MIEGEFESLKAIHAVTPSFTPEPFAWGRYQKEDPETYFLLAEFREIGEQPPDPVKFTARLAELHRNPFHQPANLDSILLLATPSSPK